MAILTMSGRAAKAMAVKALPIHLAWGTGDPAWDVLPEPPPEEVGASSLLNEVGRRKVTQALYCVPSTTGELIVPNGRFTVSNTPTRFLYLRFVFDFEDAAGVAIREQAVFLGTQAKATVPAGRQYLQPDDVADPGLMFVLERNSVLNRDPEVRQQFGFVIQF